jgi:hypothetical protein
LHETQDWCRICIWCLSGWDQYEKGHCTFSTSCFAIHTGNQALVFAFLVARSPSASFSTLPTPCSSATASCNSSFSPSLTSIAIRCRLEIPSFFNSALSSCVDVGYCACLAVNAWRMLALQTSSRFRLSAKVSGLAFFRALKKDLSCSSSSGGISRSCAVYVRRPSLSGSPESRSMMKYSSRSSSSNVASCNGISTA